MSSVLTEELVAPHGGEVVLLRRKQPVLREPEWTARQRATLVAKRAFDIAVSGTLLLLTAPLILLLALLVKLDSPGPAFYIAERAGHRGRRLRMHKFRKMRNDGDGRKLTTDDDERFTRIGRFLTKHKLDELPQLWDVFRGEMSIVGPRPESAEFVAHHPEAYRKILRMRPGIIGFSQIAFAEENRILDDLDPVGHYLDRIMPQKVGLDIMYVENPSLRVDLRVLFWASVAVLLRRQVAVHRETGRMNLRRR